MFVEYHYSLIAILFGIIRINNKESNDIISERISINPSLGNHGMLNIDVLKLFRGNILTLRKFENIF